MQNIDLHALTGWIPERITLNSAEKEKVFKMLISRYEKGDVLITFATGEFSDAEGERTGLVPGHAYAMLDVKLVANRRLFLLKNPWSHMRWKGKYSERDSDSWTAELQRELHFDPKSASNFDNGVFWIDIDSLFRFFDVCYLSWNPAIFKYSFCTHEYDRPARRRIIYSTNCLISLRSIWNAGLGPVKDLYYIGDNPQYSLTIKNPESSTWILLTRHIVDRVGVVWCLVPNFANAFPLFAVTYRVTLPITASILPFWCTRPMARRCTFPVRTTCSVFLPVNQPKV